MSKVMCITRIPNDDDPRTPGVEVGDIFTIRKVFKKGLSVIWMGRRYILQEDYFSFIEIEQHHLYAASHFAEVSHDFTFEETAKEEKPYVYYLQDCKTGKITRLGLGPNPLK